MKINQNIKQLRIILFIVIVMSYGCSEKVEIPPPQFDSSDVLENKTDQLNAHIYIDSTVSMQGFVNPGDSTNYAKTVQNLETSFITAWDKVKINFYQFGTSIMPLNRQDYLRARTRDFYITDEISRETHIEKIFNAPSTYKKDNLSVIVTDLFQHDADIPILITSLREKCIKNKLAVGVLGIRSQFKGVVYDVGTQAYSFNYDSRDRSERYRPFYLIILGKHSDVANYYTRLKSSLPSFISDDSFVILSNHISYPLASFKRDSFKEIKNLVQDNIISFQKDTINNLFIKEFIIRGSSDEDVGFTVNLKYEKLPYTINFNGNLLETKVRAEYFDKSAKSFIGNNEALRSFKIEKVNFYNNDLQITASLVSSSLHDGVYRYELIIQPSSSAYQINQWWQKWDMNSDKIEQYRQNPESFDGSKTYNLSLFMDNLLQATYITHQPKIAKIYCYFNK